LFRVEEVADMNGRPIWGVSVWGAFICLLFSLISLIHAALAASALMLIGALALLAWAVWLERSSG
jgi:hypothetical protein